MGLTLSPDGFVPVDEVLNCQGRHPNFRSKPASGGLPCRHWTVQDVRDVVETNDKRRFKLEERRASDFDRQRLQKDDEQKEETEDPWILCIRANQGHSIGGILDPNRLLTQLSPTELVTEAVVPMIVHGTYEAVWDDNIRTEGLKCMGRNHIHFAMGLPPPRKRGERNTMDDAAEEATKSTSVTSGIRRSCQIYIYVDANKCAQEGIVFYRSDNGVLLTNGINGTLPVEYFSHVTTASGSILLDQRKS